MSIQSPAFARRISGSTLTPVLSTPLLSRSSDPNVHDSKQRADVSGLADVLGILRLLKTISPGDLRLGRECFLRGHGGDVESHVSAKPEDSPDTLRK